MLPLSRFSAADGMKFTGLKTDYPLWRVRLLAAWSTAGFVAGVDERKEDSDRCKANAWFLLLSLVPEAIQLLILNCNGDPTAALQLLDTVCCCKSSSTAGVPEGAALAAYGG